MTAPGYDLLIGGGRVLSPGDGLDGHYDIAVRGGSRTRVLCHLNLARIGLTGLLGELRPELVDPDGAARLIREHPGTIVGIKLRLSERITGGPCRPMLELGARVAAGTGRPLHVHIGGTAESMTELLPLLSPGDT